ncbi:MAG: hypothetical protein EOP91_04440 [Lysobacteraceae bacterium]|nr:MAG: hypothetical protein EOP91_04440 [Xanthomonadaceae bacterium]
MKNRLGALACLALLAGCAAQDDQARPGANAGSQSPEAIQMATANARLAAMSRDKSRTLGSAPDKGGLFAYADKKGVKQRGAYTLLPVQLSEEHAFRGVATGMMKVPAPDGSEISIRYERHEEGEDGNWSWIGKVVGGDAAQEAIITFGEHAVFGSIPQAVGPALRLTTENGVAYLMKADPAKLIKAHRAGGDTKIASRYVAANLEQDDALVGAVLAKAASQAGSGIESKAFTSANTIDLAVGYSDGFVTARGGASAAATRISNLVTVANQALVNSNVNARVRVVQAVQVAYADNTANNSALEQLTGRNDTGPVTIPAAFNALRAARDQYGADLVTLIRDFQPLNDGCGIAWLIGGNQAPIVPASDAAFGYSVVSDGDYDQGGNTYFCDDITLIHEMAHNMGSQHDLANNNGVTGRYPYSYGYKSTAAQGNFYTVMAYGDDNQQLYRLFSTPALTTCGGFACGVADQADNARSLRQTIPLVTSFRNVVVPIPGAARNDINGDGKSDVLFTNASARQFSYRLMNGTAVTSSKLIGGVGAGYSIAATGDFNGDGKHDLLWTSANLDLYIWTGNGSTFTSTKAGTYPSGWKVVGAGDVDGDGKSDIVFHNASTRQISYRIMNGAVTTRSGLINGAGAGYTVAAIGDFNADGKADLVWTSANLDLYMWTGNGNTFTSAKFGTYPSGWKVVGAGDIDADGRSDVLFHNATTRQLSYRIMNGTVTTRSGLISGVGAGYTVGATGDFNGDGKLDLVWTSGLRDLYMWTGNGTSFVSLRVGDYPSGWVLED